MISQKSVVSRKSLETNFPVKVLLTDFNVTLAYKNSKNSSVPQICDYTSSKLIDSVGFEPSTSEIEAGQMSAFEARP